jgi:hypothetical protein
VGLQGIDRAFTLSGKDPQRCFPGLWRSFVISTVRKLHNLNNAPFTFPGSVHPNTQKPMGSGLLFWYHTLPLTIKPMVSGLLFWYHAFPLTKLLIVE